MPRTSSLSGLGELLEKQYSVVSDLRDVRAVVADAVQLGRCTVGQLAQELGSGPVKGSAMFRSALGEVADGIRSTTEGDLRDLIRTARLPTPLFNPSLYAGDVFLGKPDAWRPDAGVAGEVDSRAWHLSPEDWDRTRRRQTIMGAAGIIVVHFSPRELRREPALVVQRIRDALNSGLAAPLSPSAPSQPRFRFNESGALRNRFCREPLSSNCPGLTRGRYGRNVGLAGNGRAGGGEDGTASAAGWVAEVVCGAWSVAGAKGVGDAGGAR